MAAMNQRKKLSAKGRILATGLSIGAAGLLAGAMAITDHTASASPSPDVVDAGTSDSGVSSPSAAPFTPTQQDPAQQTPSQQTPAQQTPTFEPHTRSGGS